MKKKLIEEYKAMLPSTETLEAVKAKGKLKPILIDSKLTLSEIKKSDFNEWQKSPLKYVCKHDQTMYEELMCVGYHPQHRELKGVIHIKLPYGFGGNCPQSPGSTQYVRFYINWNNDGDFTDEWEDQGLGIVHVFDPGSAYDNKLPLEYAVQKRIGVMFPDWLWEKLESKCLVRRVRAILSWVTIPPAEEPNWKPFWGNVFETNIRFHK
ncbi:MAG: hypothetical protein PVF58_04915 [Candidatus Methanofastidiosia archaeon]|jgi:hypothetical protein